MSANTWWTVLGLMMMLGSALAPVPAAERSRELLVWEGDRTVVGTESFDGADIIVRGNLTVRGDLTLSNVELVMDCPWSGAFRILVEDGGSLTIRNFSSVRAADARAPYLFQVRPAATLMMDGSELSGCGHDAANERGISPTHERGLYIESSNVTMTNSTISRCRVGIIVDNGSSPVICRNTIQQNFDCGIKVLGLSSPLIDGNTICQNVQGSYSWETGGIHSDASSPVITNNTISSNNGGWASRTTGIYLTGGGAPLVANNSITSHVMGHFFGWGIYSERTCAQLVGNDISDNDNGIFLDGGSCTLVGNIIDGNGPDSDGVGLHDRSASESMNNTYIRNAIGVLLGDGSRTCFHRDRFVSNADEGLNGDTSTAPYDCILEDCTFNGNGQDIALTAPWGGACGGMVELHRPVMDTRRIDVSDEAAVLVVKWDLRIRAVYESDGRPAADARLSLMSARGNLVAELFAGEDGWTGTVLLEEFRYSGTSRMASSPFKVTARAGPRVNATAVVKLDRSLDLTVVLDDVPPWARLETPAENALTNLPRVVVSGSCEPGASVLVNDRPAAVDDDGRWSLEMELEKEGANRMHVLVRDGCLNQFRMERTVFRDTLSPAITLEEPPEWFRVNTPEIVLKGRVSDPASKLTLGGAPVRLDADGEFQLSVPLAEGQNVLELEARDAAGNAAVLVRRGFSDTRAPHLDVREPDEGFATPEALLRVRGTVEPGATLSVNGRAYSAMGGAFSILLDLREGLNRFSFSARDRAGNIRELVRNFTRDSVPPALQILSPSEGARLNSTSLKVTGSVEPGATVRVLGQEVWSTGGKFQTEVRLVKEGPSDILVEARDALGNTAVRKVTIFLDTVPPLLRIISPDDRVLVNGRALEIAGRTDPGAVVLLDGRRMPVLEGGLFVAPVVLAKEGKNVFKIEALDDSGNVACILFSAFRDTEVRFELSSPAQGERVKGPTVTVSGWAEPGAAVFVNGRHVPLAPNGRFSVAVPLARGANAITVEAADPAGNRECTEIAVHGVSPSPPGEGGIPAWTLASAALALLAVLGAAFRQHRKKT